MRKDRLEGTLSTPSFRRPITRETIDNAQARYDNIIESDTNLQKCHDTYVYV